MIPPVSNSPRKQTFSPPAFAGYLLLAAAYCLSAFVLLGGSPATHLLTIGDGVTFFYPAHALLRETILSGHLPLWNPYNFAGFPMAADPQFAAWFPPNLLSLLLPPVVGFNLRIVFYLWLAGWGTHRFLIRLGVSRIPAIIGSLSFAYGGALMARLMVQPTMVAVAAIFPFLASLILSHRFRKRETILSAFLVGMMWLAGHPQVALYLTAAFWLLLAGRQGRRLLRCRRRGISGLRLAAAVTTPLIVVPLAGALLAAIQLIPTAELARQSVRVERTREFLFSYRLTPSTLPLLLFPYLNGDYNGDNWPRFGYQGPWNLNELSCYPGQLPLAAGAMGFLAIGLGILRRHNATGFLRFPRRKGLPWAILAAASLLLALGNATPAGELLYRLPPLNLFRCPARFLILFQFGLAALAALAIEGWLRMPPRTRVDRLPVLAALGWILAALSVLALWSWAGRDGAAGRVLTLLGLPSEASSAFRLLFRHSGVWGSLLLALGGLALASAVLLAPPARRRRAGALAITLWCGADLIVHAANTFPYPENIPERCAERFDASFLGETRRMLVAIPWEGSYGLRFETLFPGLNWLEGITSAAGHSPLAPRDLCERTGISVIGGVETTDKILGPGQDILKALGIRYLALHRGIPGPARFPDAPSEASDLLGHAPPWQALVIGGRGEARAEGATVALRAGNPDTLAQAEVPVPVRPDKYYRLRFTARLQAPATGLPLHVDLFGQDYDSDSRETRIPDTLLDADPKAHEICFFSGKSPKVVCLRFFTRSSAGLHLEDIRLEEMPVPYEASGLVHGGADLGPLEVWRLEGPPLVHVQTDQGNPVAGAVVRWKETPNRYEIDMAGAVFAAPRVRLLPGIRHARGWSATVVSADGRRGRAPVFSGDNLEIQVLLDRDRLRALNIRPDDSFRVTLRYRPSSFLAGATVSIVMAAALALLWIRGLQDSQGRRRFHSLFH